MMTNEEIDEIRRKLIAIPGVVWGEYESPFAALTILCAQAKLANKYPHLPVEPPGCPTPGACSAVRFVAGAEKGMPEEPKERFCPCSFAHHPHDGCDGTPAPECDLIPREYHNTLRAHALSLAAQLAEATEHAEYSAEVEEEYDKVKLIVEQSALEPAPASTMAIKPLHLRVQNLLAQLVEVRGDAERWRVARLYTLQGVWETRLRGRSPIISAWGGTHAGEPYTGDVLDKLIDEVIKCNNKTHTCAAIDTALSQLSAREEGK